MSFHRSLFGVANVIGVHCFRCPFYILFCQPYLIGKRVLGAVLYDIADTTLRVYLFDFFGSVDFWRVVLYVFGLRELVRRASQDLKR